MTTGATLFPRMPRPFSAGWTTTSSTGWTSSGSYATWRSLPRLSADEAGRAISELRRDLSEIEIPGVTTEPDDYWQVILGQVENRFAER